MSGNLWGDLSKISQKKNPLNVLKEQSGYLLDATDHIIYADSYTRAPNLYHEPEKEFALEYSIRSKMMEKYKFELFTLFYDITFFPMEISIDENISESLGMNNEVIINNEQEFNEVIKLLLSSDFTKNVISSLYIMSK